MLVAVPELVVKRLLLHHLQELLVLKVFPVNHLVAHYAFHLLIIVVIISSVVEDVLALSVLILLWIALLLVFVVGVEGLHQVDIAFFVNMLDVLLRLLVSHDL